MELFFIIGSGVAALVAFFVFQIALITGRVLLALVLAAAGVWFIQHALAAWHGVVMQRLQGG